MRLLLDHDVYLATSDYLRGLGGHDVVRVSDIGLAKASQAAVHAEFERVLASYTEVELGNAFVVVEPDRHRYRRLST